MGGNFSRNERVSERFGERLDCCLRSVVSWVTRRIRDACGHEEAQA